MKTILARITLISTVQGGRRSPITPLRDFGCPVFFKNIPELADHGYDCRLLVHEAGTEILPGGSEENVAMAFLSPEKVMPHIRVGTKFDLWEGKVIGAGEITAIID